MKALYNDSTNKTDRDPSSVDCSSSLYEDSAKAIWCPEEGNDLPETKKKHWISRRKILMNVAASLALVLITVLGTMAYMNSPQRGINQEAEALYESAESAVSAGDYDSALNTIALIDTSWSGYSKVSALKQRAVNGMLKERAISCLASGDYVQIIELANANESICSDAEFRGIYDSAVSEYRSLVLADAKQAFSNQGYESAIAALDKGLFVLNDDAILLSEKEIYAQYAPVDLTSLSPYYEGYITVFTDGATDNLGNHYATGMRGYMSSDYSNCYNLWDIGGRYNKLTATGIVFESQKSSVCVGSYRIYGGGRLLYERDNISSQTKPYNIEIDISGVTDLKIEMFGEGNMGANGINSVLVNVMLHRAP